METFVTAPRKEEKAALAEKYYHFLQGRGLAPTINEGGDVQFTQGNLLYVILVHPEDPGYFRLALPNLFWVEAHTDRKKVLEAMNETNFSAKGAKLYTVGKGVWAVIETFMDSPDRYEAIFDRILGALPYAAGVFGQSLRRGGEVGLASSEK